MSGESKILQALHESKLEEDKWITIKGTHVQVDDNGTIKNDKLKDKIEKTSGKKVSAARKSLDGNVISVNIKNKALASAASGVGEKIKKALEKVIFLMLGGILNPHTMMRLKI